MNEPILSHDPDAGLAAPQDFPDWLSPVLVKELRQGMRSRALVFSLFLLQSLLILIAIASFGAGQHESDNEVNTAFFWATISLPLIAILPLAALGSIGRELKDNTLELIFLTKLTARRIVVGKWTASVAQAILLAVTVLPYLAFRYYLGGVNVVDDLILLGLALVASATLSSLMIAISPYQSRIVRIILGVGIVFVLFNGGYAVLMIMAFGGGRVVRGGGWMDWRLFAGIAALIPLLVMLFLEVAAARIAPLAENHAGTRRLLTLLIVIVCGITGWLVADAQWLLIAGMVVLFFVCAGSLSANLVELPTLFAPFVRRGFPGRLAGHFFVPGGPAGFLFTLVALAVVAGFWALFGWLKFNGDEQADLKMISLLSYSATLLAPAAITRLESRKRILLFLAFIAISAVLFFVVVAVGANLGNDSIYQISAFLPPVGIFAPAFRNAGTISSDAFIVEIIPALKTWMICLNVLAIVLIPLRARAAFRRMGELEAAAKRLTNPDHAATNAV